MLHWRALWCCTKTQASLGKMRHVISIRALNQLRKPTALSLPSLRHGAMDRQRKRSWPVLKCTHDISRLCHTTFWLIKYSSVILEMVLQYNTGFTTPCIQAALEAREQLPPRISRSTAYICKGRRAGTPSCFLLLLPGHTKNALLYFNKPWSCLLFFYSLFP